MPSAWSIFCSVPLKFERELLSSLAANEMNPYESPSYVARSMLTHSIRSAGFSSAP